MADPPEASEAVEQRRSMMEDHPFKWLLRPADPVPIKDIRCLEEAANSYFTNCYLYDRVPRLTGLALALGCAGPAGLQRMAQRRPELREIVSRCLTAVGHAYEEMIGDRNAAGPIFMLKHLAEFDPAEPAGSKPVQYWNEKRELVINARVHGAKTIEDRGSNLTPEEAYYKIIHRGAYEEAVYEEIEREPQNVLEAVRDDDSED